MLTSKGVFIQDACILFDLIDLGLMPLLFELNITVVTTPQVIFEVLDGDQLSVVNDFINDGRLKVDTSGDIAAIQNVLATNKGLSFADSSVLEIAIRLNGTVLSSDLKLRSATIRNGLTVRGILWVIEELHLAKLIATRDAINKLSLYEMINNRAPRTEIKLLVERMSKAV